MDGLFESRISSLWTLDEHHSIEVAGEELDEQAAEFLRCRVFYGQLKAAFHIRFNGQRRSSFDETSRPRPLVPGRAGLCSRANRCCLE